MSGIRTLAVDFCGLRELECDLGSLQAGLVLWALSTVPWAVFKQLLQLPKGTALLREAAAIGECLCR